MPDSPPTCAAAFHQEFSDFDSFEAAAGGWNLDFLQLDPGDFRASLTQVATAKVILSRCSLGRRFLQRGETPPNFRTFGISVGDHFSIKWRGHEVGPEHLMIFPPGNSLESVTPPGFDAFAFSISESCLDHFAKTRGLEGRNAILPLADLMQVPKDECAKLRSLLFKLLKQSIDHPERVATPEFSHEIDHDFVEALWDTLAAGSEIENMWEDSPSRSIGFERALELMKARADQAISISEVQEYAGVSERTLQYAFQDAYGMSPKSYLHHLRLNRFRLELIRNPKCPVGRLAKRWGFRHMGQLSKDYQKLFGELPSKTNRHPDQGSDSPSS